MLTETPNLNIHTGSLTGSVLFKSFRFAGRIEGKRKAEKCLGVSNTAIDLRTDIKNGFKRRLNGKYDGLQLLITPKKKVYQRFCTPFYQLPLRLSQSRKGV